MLTVQVQRKNAQNRQLTPQAGLPVTVISFV
jgi:hypothetical protein